MNGWGRCAAHLLPQTDFLADYRAGRMRARGQHQTQARKVDCRELVFGFAVQLKECRCRSLLADLEAGDLGVEEAYSGVEETLLGVEKAFPGLEEALPGFEEAFPGFEEAFPDFEEAFPVFEEGGPAEGAEAQMTILNLKLLEGGGSQAQVVAVRSPRLLRE